MDQRPLAITVAIPVSYKLHPDTTDTVTPESASESESETGENSWPFELYPSGLAGLARMGAVNVSVSVGEMIIYEGHSLIHGRPTPLDAEHAAYMYVHYSPSDYHKTNAHGDPGLTAFLQDNAAGAGAGENANRHLYVAHKVSPDAAHSVDIHLDPLPLLRPVSDVKQYIDFVYTYDVQPLSLEEHEDYKGRDGRDLADFQQLWRESYGEMGEGDVLRTGTGTGTGTGIDTGTGSSNGNTHHAHEL